MRATTTDAASKVVVVVVVEGPPTVVWEALTDPTQVARWDGAEPVAVPTAYPAPGQQARWRTRLGPLHLVLHDRVRVVEAPRRLVSTIDVGFVHLEEEYLLGPAGDGTVVVSQNEVSCRIGALAWLARRLTRRDVHASMRRLADFCSPGGGAGSSLR